MGNGWSGGMVGVGEWWRWVNDWRRNGERGGVIGIGEWLRW